MDSPYTEFGAWIDAPNENIRKNKLKLEEELMIKLGAKKEVIEYHPLILSSRVERAKSFIGLQYSRTSQPFTEKSVTSRNSWICQDQALRQMSNLSRRGPRDIMLPNLVKSPTQLKLNDVPDADFGFFSRRDAILERLTQVLSEWTVYQKRAFPPLISRLSNLSKPSSASQKVKHAKSVSLQVGQERRRRTSGWSWSASSDNSGDGPRVRRRRRKRNRWDRMAQEALLQIKASHMRLPFELPKSELRIYVSSTPDLHEEREFLEEVAYPKLKELAEKLGLNCHFVDMRKGSGHLSNDIETFDLIQRELQNCRRLSIGPYFISLLGHQLDDQKLPGFLEKAVYEMIRETLIRDDIIGVEMFDEAYRLDSNRQPPVYIKQALQAIDEYEGPEQVEQILLTALNKASALIKERRTGNHHNDVDFYKWSAVVKEVECGLLKSYNPRRDTLCFMFDDSTDAMTPPTPNTPSMPEPEDPMDRLRHRVRSHLHCYASKSSLMHFKSGKKTIAYLRSLADTFIARVASLLKSQLHQHEYDVTQQLTEGSEALQHVRVALSESENVAGSGVLLAKVRETLDTYDGAPTTILLEGDSAMGKTTLVSQIATSSSLWQPRWKIVFRSLGFTLRSSSLFRALESLIKQLSFIYALNVTLPIHAGLHDTLEIFCDMLKAISDNQKQSDVLLLILDNLDKLPELDSHFLLSILNALDEGIILILTFDSKSSFVPLLKSHETVKSLKMTHLNKAEMKDFINTNLSGFNRRLTIDQLKRVLKAIPQDASPVYMQLILNVVRWWPSHTLPKMEKFIGDAEMDFNIFLDVLEAGFGRAFTRYALSFMATARHGLGDNELVHLLAEDSDLLNEIKVEQVESVSVVEGFSCQFHLSRLLSHLGKFVMEVKMEGETVFQLSSRTLITSINKRYLSDSFFYTIHKRLAMFFLFIRRGLLLSSKDISEKRQMDLVKLQWRTLRCVPYHLCYSSNDTDEVWQLLKDKVFFNFSWIVNEVYSGFFNDFLNDIKYALEHVDLDPHIQYLQYFLISIRHTVIHNPMSLAAIFSSQNIQEADVVKDSIRAIVQDAREWLKQIHTQALVPENYTSDKTNRLIIKRNNLKGVDEVLSDGVTAQLFLLRGRSLSVVKMVSGEEIQLTTFDDNVHELIMTENRKLIALTRSESQEIKVTIISAEKENDAKVISLGNSQLLWFDFRSTSEAYFATNEGIKMLDSDMNKVRTILSVVKKPWMASHVTLSTAKIVTFVTEDKLKMDILSPKQGEFKRISFKKKELNQYCNSILSTKDGKYIVVVFDREAIVIDALRYEELESLSLNGLPILHAILSRSHEHLFLAYANGAMTCHVLYTGNQSMETKIIPKAQHPLSTKSRGRTPRPQSHIDSPGDHKLSPMSDGTSTPMNDSERRHSKLKVVAQSSDTETVTTMVTSEDDHFLFCGTTRGIVYGIHVPSGLQVVAILTRPQPVKRLLYLTNREHFQHLVILNDEGRSFHWNLRPLLKQARVLLHDFIIDEDLSKEEIPKRELRTYYPVFEMQRHDRVFLNGPDIAAFYKDPPANIFASLEELDPAFKPVKDWEETGTIADCSDNIKVFVTGNKLSDILLTISRDQRLARWSLYDGRLIWARRLPYGSGKIQDAALVYYDQALLLTEKSDGEKGLRISVIYIGENQSKVLTRTHVIGYWASEDRCQIMIMCRNPIHVEELSICHWDLLNAREEISEYQESIGEDGVAKENILFTTFSPDLTQMIRLSLFMEDSEESNTNVNKDRSFELLQRASTTVTNIDGIRRQNSAKGQNRSSLGNRMFRVDSLTSDLFRSSSRQEDADCDLNYKEGRPESFSPEKEKEPENEQGDETEEKSANVQEDDQFIITTLLSWNKLHLRNREYALEAKRRSLANSRLSFSESERKDVRSPPVKQLDENDTTKGGNETTTRNENGKQCPSRDTDTDTDGRKMDGEGGEVERKEDLSDVKSKNATTSSVPVTIRRESVDGEEKGEYQDDACTHSSVSIRIELSAINFISEENILIGTNSSHVMLLTIPSFQLATVLTADEPRLVPVEKSGISLAGIESPHKSAVNFVGSSEDGSKLVSADASVLCLWNTADRMLGMAIHIDDGKEMTHMVISKNAAIIIIATNDKVIHVWTSIGTPRRIASYMTSFHVLDLQMSCDCHKVIVGGHGQESEFLLEIFEMKNIDDVLMHVPARKRSQESVKTDDSGEGKAKRRGSRRLSTIRRSSTSINVSC